MKMTLRSSAAVVTLIAGLLLAAPAEADFRVPGFVMAAALDVVILRPLGVVATVSGAALFLPAVLVTSPGGRDSIEEALERFVTEPAKSVYQRPLGEF